jgi:Ring finger domain
MEATAAAADDAVPRDPRLGALIRLRACVTRACTALAMTAAPRRLPATPPPPPLIARLSDRGNRVLSEEVRPARISQDAEHISDDEGEVAEATAAAAAASRISRGGVEVTTATTAAVYRGRATERRRMAERRAAGRGRGSTSNNRTILTTSSASIRRVEITAPAPVADEHESWFDALPCFVVEKNPFARQFSEEHEGAFARAEDVETLVRDGNVPHGVEHGHRFISSRSVQGSWASTSASNFAENYVRLETGQPQQNLSVYQHAVDVRKDTASALYCNGDFEHGAVPEQHKPSAIASTRSSLSATDCAICLCDFEAGDEVVALPCIHFFHSQCVKAWLVQTRTCPLCRSTVFRSMIQARRPSAQPARAAESLANPSGYTNISWRWLRQRFHRIPDTAEYTTGAENPDTLSTSEIIVSR